MEGLVTCVGLGLRCGVRQGLSCFTRTQMEALSRKQSLSLWFLWASWHWRVTRILPCCKIRSWIFVGWTHSKASEPTETDAGVWGYDMGFVRTWVVLLVVKWRLWVGRNCCGFVGKLTVEGDQNFTMKYVDHSWVLSEWIPFSRPRSTLHSVFEKPFFAWTQEFSSF